MYLGEWAPEGFYKRGFGVTYYSTSKRVFIGIFKGKNDYSGEGICFFLPDSTIWKNNERTGSPISCKDSGKGLPHIYMGDYNKISKRDDPRAKLILKNGTTRVGRWVGGEAIGNWWEDHKASWTGQRNIMDILSFEDLNLLEGVVVKKEEDSDPDAEDREETFRMKAHASTKRRHDQIVSVAEWLKEDGIGCNALIDEMEEHAQKLCKLGLHSVAAIE